MSELAFEEGERVVICPAAVSDFRGKEGIICSVADSEASAQISPYSVWVHFNDLRNPEDCDECLYRLHKVIGRCPRST